MAIHVSRHPSDHWAALSRAWLRWCQGMCFILGGLALAYVAFAYLDATIYQNRRNRQLDQALQEQELQLPLKNGAQNPDLSLSVGIESERSRSDDRDIAAARDVDTTLGRVQVSTIGLAVMVLEGIDGRTLRRGVGHVPGTSLPGEQGNVVIAGHRDTFFRELRNLNRNDEIDFETRRGSFRYSVDFIQIVESDNTRILDTSDESILTLITCYPFQFIGPAPKRFIVRAHLLSKPSNW